MNKVFEDVYRSIISRMTSHYDMARYLRMNFDLSKAEMIWQSGDYERYIRYSTKILKDVDTEKAQFWYNHIVSTMIVKK